MRFSFRLICLLLLTLTFASAQENAISWQDIQKSKKGTVTVYWFPNEPFGYQTRDGQMAGIEVDIITGFKKYLGEVYKIDISFNWVKENTFKEALAHMKNDSAKGIFGVAGISFSEERKTFMKFSPSYMVDMAVLVSTKDIPIVKSKEDLKKYLAGATALTAQGTILERDLIKLKDENHLNFNIEHTGGTKELIKILTNRKKSFGYLNLPVYLISLDKGLNVLNRQNYLTKRYEGRGIGFTRASDWDVPMKQYFNQPNFSQTLDTIIGHYIDINLYRVIETLSPENEVALLNTEKALQEMRLNLKEITIQDKNEKQVYLVTIIVVFTVLLIIITLQFRRQRQSHLLLKEQKAEIEAQSDEIKAINDNLELIIQQRTHEVENKNKALEEYAFITAHKLRAPLARILGLVILFENVTLEEEDKIILTHLSKSAKDLDEIVRSVMNAIDSDS
jgi:ABC-type amino acid transport substrate-binding protein/NACalpha-BTF3-like transcription factor